MRFRALIFLGLLLSFSTYIHGQNVNGGIITFTNGDSLNSICNDNTSVLIDVILRGQTGQSSTWIITDTSEVIIDIIEFPPFDPKNYTIDEYFIYHLSYNQLSDLSTGSHKDSISGVFDYSNRLTITTKTVGASNLSLIQGNIDIDCVNRENTQLVVFQVDSLIGDQSALVIFNTEGRIVKILDSLSFQANEIRESICNLMYITWAGSALVGIELQSPKDFDGLITRMKAQHINYEHLNENPKLFEMLV